MTESAERGRIRRELVILLPFASRQCPFFGTKGVFDVSKGLRKEGDTSGITETVHGHLRPIFIFNTGFFFPLSFNGYLLSTYYIPDTSGLDTHGPPSEAYVQCRRERQEISKKNKHDGCCEGNICDKSIGEFRGGDFGERDIKEGLSEEEKFKRNEGKCADTEKRRGGGGPCGP